MKNDLIKHGFRYEFYKSTMPFIYNIGAAIVILGAMFKLLNLPGGSLMLGIGLSTEALIFLLSAFEPNEQEGVNELVHHKAKLVPNLTQKLDECLQQSQIDAPLLDHLAASMRSFSENITHVPSFAKVGEVTEAYVNNVQQAAQAIGDVAKINDAVANTLHSFTTISSDTTLSNYFCQMKEITNTLTSMNLLYKRELDDIQEKTTGSHAFYNHLESALQAMEGAGNEAIHFKKELALLNEKVTSLNEIYAKTLTAFRS